MAGPSNPQTLNKTFLLTDDDDFQDPSPSQLRLPKPTSKIASRQPLGTYNSATPRTFKKPKQNSPHGGKENSVVVGKYTADLDLGRGLDSSRPNKKAKQHPVSAEKGCLSPVVVEKFEENRKSLNPVHQKSETDFEDLELGHGLDTIESTIDCFSGVQKPTNEEELKRGYLFKSIEARLLNSNGGFEERKEEESEECSELDLLLKLCGEEDEVDGDALSADLPRQEECLGLDEEYGLICCPLCGADISDLSGEMRQVHTNECLDKEETPIDVRCSYLISVPYCMEYNHIYLRNMCMAVLN